MVTLAPIACKHKVSGSFSLPSRGPFHLSLTVLFSIGHWVVFRLGGWAPQLQTGFHVSGPTLDTACLLFFSLTGLLPSLAQLSSCIQLKIEVHSAVHNPDPRKDRFGLFPVRSPLLRKSRLLSLPTGT